MRRTQLEQITSVVPLIAGLDTLPATSLMGQQRNIAVQADENLKEATRRGGTSRVSIASMPEQDRQKSPHAFNANKEMRGRL